jgi:hypothetical protein
VIDKASFDAFLYKTLSWLDSLKRCRPRGLFVDSDVNRRTRTEKYIALGEYNSVSKGGIGIGACNG